MSTLKQSQFILELSNFLLTYSTTLMGVGVHTSRVERNVARIADSFGYKVEMTIFQKHITMSVLSKEDDSVRRTAVRRIPHQGFNFDIISRLSTLSWDAYDHRLSLGELNDRFHKIITTPRIHPRVVLILVAFANAAFCRLFGGDPYAMALVFAGTFAGFFLKQQLAKAKLDNRFIIILAALVSSLIASIGIRYNLSETPQVALATSVLFLIPGVPLINSIIDLLEGHVLVGITRGINAIMMIISIAIGLSVTLLLLGVDLL